MVNLTNLVNKYTKDRTRKRAIAKAQEAQELAKIKKAEEKAMADAQKLEDKANKKRANQMKGIFNKGIKKQEKKQQKENEARVHDMKMNFDKNYKETEEAKVRANQLKKDLKANNKRVQNEIEQKVHNIKMNYDKNYRINEIINQLEAGKERVAKKEDKANKKKVEQNKILLDSHYDENNLGSKRQKLIDKLTPNEEIEKQEKEKVVIDDHKKEIELIGQYKKQTEENYVNKISNLNNIKDEKNKILDFYREIKNGDNKIIRTDLDVDINNKIFSPYVGILHKNIENLSKKEQQKVIEKYIKNYGDAEGRRLLITDNDIVVLKEKYTDKRIKKENTKLQQEVINELRDTIKNINQDIKDVNKEKREIIKGYNDQIDGLKNKTKRDKESVKQQFKDLLERLPYDYEVVDDYTIERVREIYDPKRRRNIRTMERISFKDLLKEQNFIDKYNQEMEDIGWDNHKITYKELNKIMHNHGYTKLSQIDRPKKYQAKVRKRAIENVLKTLYSSGLGNTDFYALVREHLNEHNIDQIIGRLEDYEISFFFASDQQKVSSSLKSFAGALNLNPEMMYRGRRVEDIIDEAERKI